MTCRDVVTLDLKQAKLIPVDEVPEDAEASVGMEVLQSLYDSWFTAGEFGVFNPYYA